MVWLEDDAEADRRRQRGDRTRRAVAVRAAERGSVDGLSAVSLAQLAADLHLSKSGIQAVYRTKQQLQLAAVAAACDIFAEHVVMPAMGAPTGLPRLRALVAAWLGYAEKKIFPGGCFMASVIPEFDSHPGPVRDALARARRDWLALLEREIRAAQASGELNGIPAPMLAFEIDALFAAANTARNMTGSTQPLHTARALIDIRLGDLAADHNRGHLGGNASPAWRVPHPGCSVPAERGQLVSRFEVRADPVDDLVDAWSSITPRLRRDVVYLPAEASACHAGGQLVPGLQAAGASP